MMAYRRNRKAHRNLALGICVGLIATGCGSQQKNALIRPPTVNAELGHFVGSSLSGARQPVPDNLGRDGVWVVEGRVVAVTQLPVSGFQRIGPLARLVIAYRGAAPVVASTRLTSSVAIQSLPATDDSLPGEPKTRQDLGNFTGGVANATTASFSVGLPTIPQPTNDQLPFRSRVAVQISRAAIDRSKAATRPVAIKSKPTSPSKSIRATSGPSSHPATTASSQPVNEPAEYILTIVGDDLVADAASGEPARSASGKSTSSNPPATTLSRELAVLHRVLDHGRDHFLLAVPFAFVDSNAVGLVFDISIDANASVEAQAKAAEALRAGAKSAAEELARQATTAPIGTSQQVLIATALRSLKQGGESTRGTLNYLASQAGASFASELALVADDKMLNQLKAEVLKQVGDQTQREPSETALLLERASAEVLNQQRSSGTDSLSSAVLGTLDSYAGEVGHQPDALIAVIRQAASVAELSNRLLAENRIYLEDTSPPARVRAFDWLKSKRIDLGSYDPLASGRDRRAALEKLRQTAAAARSVAAP